MDLLTAKLTLAAAPGVGSVIFKQALAADPICSWRKQPQLINALPIPITAKAFLKQENPSIQKILDWAKFPGNQLICLDDLHYPKLLKETHDPPPFLYIQGKLENLHEPQLGIVGCRDMTPYGQMLALRFAKDLAALGIAITSGLAYGIDGIAHQGALKAKGITIAVLGTGLNKIYPEAHTRLSQDILAKGGTLVSEFPPDTGIKREHFPQRNRIISGLSLGILVIEAARKSGSLITAKYALEQNRLIFAVPGAIDSPTSKGCHQLLREGAILVEEITDILTELHQPLNRWCTRPKPEEALDKYAIMKEITLDLLENLRFNTPKSLDELALLSGKTHEFLQREMLALELARKIKRVPGGYIKLKEK